MKFLFSGSYSHNMDDRGRLAIPAKMREKLGDVVWVNLGLGDYLVIYPDDSWLGPANDVLSVPPWFPEATDLRLELFANLVQCEIDKQGRILIPPLLLEMAKIRGNVVIAGLGDHIQIWDTNAFVEKMKQLRANPPVLPRYQNDRTPVS
jgi:MraZ protein